MKSHGHVIVAGKVGDLDIVCDEIVASVHEKLSKLLEVEGGPRPVVALRRRDGELVMATVTYAEVVEHQPGIPALSLDLDVPDEAAEPPAPHVAGVERLDEILGDDPLRLRGGQPA